MNAGKLPVSVVIITKNEEDKIGRCLGSVTPWADEAIVVDDESTDRTREIAAKCGGKVIIKKMDIEGKHRNYSYGLARNEWVLSLDADEVVSDRLREELRGLFRKGAKDTVFTVPIRTYLASYWIRYGGWYPAAKVRLFQKSRFKYEEVEVHPRAFYAGGEGTCGHLKGDIIHYSYRDFHDFFASLNNQTTQEAKKWFNERRKITFFKMFKKASSRFIKRYFFKRGFKDGIIGFVIAYGDALYQVMSYAKYELLLKEESDNAKG